MNTLRINKFNNRLWQLLTLAVSAIYAPALWGHSVEIETLVNSITNRKFVIESFLPSEIILDGNDAFSDSPGIGVSSTFNGLTSGTQLSLEITQALLYWDGRSLTTPTSGLTVYNPSFSDNRYISALSGPQPPLTWAAYSGINNWHADGQYFLDSMAAPAGVYGIAARLRSTDHQPTKPFLIPLVFDPLDQLTDIDAGVEILRSAVVVPGDADFDADRDIDGSDFLAWQLGYLDGLPTPAVLPSHGDADLDSDVDHIDLTFWQQQYGSKITPTVTATLFVPEPHTALLTWSAGILLAIRLRTMRRTN